MAESMVGLMDPTNRMETWDEEEDRVVSHSIIPYCLGAAPFMCVPTRRRL